MGLGACDKQPYPTPHHPAFFCWWSLVFCHRRSATSIFIRVLSMRQIFHLASLRASHDFAELWGSLRVLFRGILRTTLGLGLGLSLAWVLLDALALPVQAAEHGGQPVEQASGHSSGQGGMAHDLNRSLHLAPPIPEERLKADRLTNQGLDKVARADYPAAIKALDQAIVADPTYDMPYIHLGDIYRTTGNVEQSIRYYSQAIDRNPTFVRLYNNRGEVLLQTGQLTQAQADFDHAVEVYPEDPQAYLNLGSLEFARQDYAAALRQVNQALDRNPFFAEAYAQRGAVRLARGNPVGAKFDYQKAAQLLSNQEKAKERESVLAIIASLP